MGYLAIKEIYISEHACCPHCRSYLQQGTIKFDVLCSKIVRRLFDLGTVKFNKRTRPIEKPQYESSCRAVTIMFDVIYPRVCMFHLIRQDYIGP
jgi:hypothetical protein